MRGAADRTPSRLGEGDSAPLLVNCGECEGCGSSGRQVAEDVWAEWPCDVCGGEGAVEALCEAVGHQPGSPAVVLVEDGIPACVRCAEDYVQGPVPEEAAPWDVT